MSKDDHFQGMCDELNADYDNPDMDYEEDEIEESSLVTTEHMEKEEDSRFLSVEDERYLTKELKSTVKSLETAMDELNGGLVGAHAGHYESMALLANARTSALKEIRALKMHRKTIQLETKKIKIQEKKADISEKKLLGTGGGDEDGDTNLNNAILLTPQQLAHMMEESRKIVNSRNIDVEEATVVPVKSEKTPAIIDKKEEKSTEENKEKIDSKFKLE